MENPATASAVFGTSYLDRRPAEVARTEHAIVQRQADHLTQLRHDGRYRRKVLDALLERRKSRGDLVQFEWIKNPQPDGSDQFELLVRSGVLIVARRDLDDDRVQALMAELDLEAAPLALIKGVVRLTPRTTDRLTGRAVDALAAIGRHAAPVTFDHVTPLGIVSKGAGGPGPSPASSHPFPGIPAGPRTRVAVIDTGITAEVRADGWLAGIHTAANDDPLDAIPAPDGFLDLGAGHGTFVTGVVQQVEPAAEVRVYRAMDSDGIGTESEVADQIRAAVAGNAQIISMSLGTRTSDDGPPPILEAALAEAFAAAPQLLVVAGAGNYGDERPVYPAAFSRTFPDNVVAVGALTAAGTPAPWSSHGPWVTCSTVGEGVVSTYVEGVEAELVQEVGDVYGPNAWAAWTGTSFATPQIAGAVARTMRENPTWTPKQAFDELVAQAAQVDDFGKVVIVLPGT